MAKILIVENNEEFRSTLKDTLQARGYTVVEAVSRAEAEAKFLERQIKAAIIDVRLEDEDDVHDWSGLIASRKVAYQVPVIILSAYDSIEDVNRAFDVAPGVKPPYEFISKNDREWQDKLLTALQEIVAEERAWERGWRWIKRVATIVIPRLFGKE